MALSWWAGASRFGGDSSLTNAPVRVVLLNGPKAGEGSWYTADEAIELELRVEDVRDGRVRITREGGVPATYLLDADAELHVRLSLPRDERTHFTIDTDGLDEPLSLEVVQDSTTPVIEVHEPLEYERRTKDSSLDLVVVIDEAHRAVEVRAGTRLMSATTRPGEYEDRGHPLRDGDQTIEFVAFDVAGNVALSSIVITHDSTPPRLLEGASEAGTRVLAGADLEVKLRFDEALRSVELDGTPMAVSGRDAQGTVSAPDRIGVWRPMLASEHACKHASGDFVHRFMAHNARGQSRHMHASQH